MSDNLAKILTREIVIGDDESQVIFDRRMELFASTALNALLINNSSQTMGIDKLTSLAADFAFALVAKFDERGF